MSTLSRVIFDADTTAPTVPTGVAATALSSSAIRITWSASTDSGGSGLLGYRVLRSTTSGGTYSQVSPDLSVASLVYDNTGLSSATQYFYRVVAFDGNANVSGQSTTVNATTQGTTQTSVSPLEADWLSRTAGPGVVWIHDFRNPAEVHNFRWDFGTGNDPNDLSVPNRTRWRSDDGIGLGGCLESFRPAGSQEPPEWWRMNSPLTGSGNGRGVNDPAANGTIAIQSYAPTQGGGQIQNWGDRGFYGNATYHAASPGAFDGTDYWFMMRMKISASRVSQPDGGKALYFTRTDLALTSQEIVLISNNVVSQLNPAANLLKMYRSGSPALDEDDPGPARQPGNTMGTCQTSPTIVSSGCYFTPSEQWFSLMWHITLGTNSGGDTRVELWRANDGELSWTKIWDQSNVNLPFGAGHPFGHNAVILVAWMNSITFTADVWHRYCQVAFGKAAFAPPSVYSTTSNAMIAEAESLTAGQSTQDIGGTNGSTGLSAQALGSIQWVNRFFYDHERRQAIVLGKYASAQSSPQGARTLSIYNAVSNSWTDSGSFMIGSTEIGHVYESIAYDPKRRRIYSARYGAGPVPIQYHNIGDPLTTWSNTATSPWSLNSNGQQAVICWHPNLFGVGDGGLIAIRLVSGTTMQLVTWREANDSWTANLVQSTAPTQHGAMTYVRYYDAVFATHANGNTYRIGAGRDLTAATPVQIANPPILCRHAGGGDNYGILIDDPTGRGGPYILEKGGSNRVWKYNVATLAWDLKSYTHPFPAGGPSGADTNWCVAECFPLGTFMCRRDTTAAGTRLKWRPND